MHSGTAPTPGHTRPMHVWWWAGAQWLGGVAVPSVLERPPLIGMSRAMWAWQGGRGDEGARVVPAGTGHWW
jgi:hypothetical protein